MKTLFLAAGAALLGAPALAADWADNAFSVRAGTAYREPFNPNDVHKTILAFTHASGHTWGTSFLNIDYLKSDSHDANADEIYLAYRHTLTLGQLDGPARGYGLLLGVDLNRKNDCCYNSRKRMLVAGPTLMWQVPGFLNTSLVALHESNAPSIVAERYTYKVHPALMAAYGIEIGAGWKLEGYANFIAAKGKNETGGSTAPETNIDMQLMHALGQGWRAGLQLQYWNNKFGNHSVPGVRATTPQIRIEYHL